MGFGAPKISNEEERLRALAEYRILGTDGFGRSDTREELRDFFEISKEHIVLNSLLLHGKKKEAEKFIKDSGMVLSKEAPWKN